MTLIIEHLKVQIEQESREHDSLLQEGGDADIEQRKFYQDLARLEDKIEKSNRVAARHTPGKHMSYGAMFPPEVREHLMEQERDAIMALITLHTSTPPQSGEHNGDLVYSANEPGIISKIEEGDHEEEK